MNLLPRCAGCGHQDGEAWPCPDIQCGTVLHLECGHGLDYEPTEPPYRINDGELVIGEWHCRACGALAGLDILVPAASVGNVVPFPTR